MTGLLDVKKHPQISEFISQTEKALTLLEYTDHGFRHANLVARRARIIAKEIGLGKREGELAAIAGFCHDMGNFLSRTYHNYIGALLFHQIFNKDFVPKELTWIMQGISNHDKGAEMKLSNAISAVLVLADKSDVHRSRVTTKSLEKIKTDVHDRVNFATKKSYFKFNSEKKEITLILKIDTNFVPVMEYFEIFTARMTYCRRAAKYLNYNFGLVINDFKLL